MRNSHDNLLARWKDGTRITQVLVILTDQICANPLNPCHLRSAGFFSSERMRVLDFLRINQCDTFADY